jgi:hypothetical protein
LSLPGLNTEKTKHDMETTRLRQEELAKLSKRGRTITETVREAEETAEKIRSGEVDDYDSSAQ